MFDWLFGSRRKQMEDLAKVQPATEARETGISDHIAEELVSAPHAVPDGAVQPEQPDTVFDAATAALSGQVASAQDTVADVGSSIHETIETGSETLSEIQNAASDKVAQVSEMVRSPATEAVETTHATLTDTAQDLADQVGVTAEHPAQELVDSASDMISNAPDTASEQAEHVRETKTTATYQPVDLDALQKLQDKRPEIGVPAIAVAPPLIEAARVVKVQAGGRRLTAVGERNEIARTYTKRADGTYWLEGTGPHASSRLIIGAEL